MSGTALKLYELRQQHYALENLMGSDELPAEVIRDTLEALEGDIKEKSVSVAMVVRNQEAAAEQIREVAKQMMARADRLDRRAESIRNYLLFNLQATGVTKIEAPEFKIAVRENPEALVVEDYAEIPPDLMRIPPPPGPVPDKTAIKAALKAGREIRGAYITRGQRLEIKA
jgi:hypothetical protein